MDKRNIPYSKEAEQSVLGSAFLSKDALQKICDAFGITLTQLFSEEGEAVMLTEQQKELLDNWIHLEAHQQEALLAFLRLM